MAEHLIQRFLRDDPSVTSSQRARLGGGEDAVLGMMSYTVDAIESAYRVTGWLWADQLIEEHAAAIDPEVLYVPHPAHLASPRAHIAALVHGYVCDMDAGRVDPLRVAEGFARTLSLFEPEDMDLAYDTDALIRELTLWTLPREFEDHSFGARMLPHLQGVLVWQRLLWLAECRRADALVLAAGETVAWPEDQEERLRWLWALTAAQPELRRAPHLARAVLAGRAPRVMVGRADVEQMMEMMPPPPEGMVDQAVSEAAGMLRAALPGETVSSDLGGLWGIERVIVSAEPPPVEGTWRLAFALEHVAGWLAGELYCGGSGQWLVESCQLAAAGDAISAGAADSLALLVLDTFLGVGPGQA